MNKKLFNLIFIASIVYIFTGCAAKDEAQEYNKPAIYCYSSLGFEIIGTLPNARRIDNKSHDLMIMTLNFPLPKE